MRLAVCCAVLCAANAARAQSYEVIDLGPGEASAINSHNEVAGVGPTGGGTIWRDGVAQDIGGGPIITGALPVAINDAGQVAGTFVPGDVVCAPDGCRPIGHAFLYTPGATDGIPTNPPMKDLGALQGLPSTQAVAMNASGQVVGVASDDVGNSRAFLWTAGATDGDPSNPQMKGLGLPPGIVSGFAQGVNDAGQAVGVGFDAGNGYHALYWHDGVVDDLGPGSANAISNDPVPLIFGQDDWGLIAWRGGVPEYLNFPDGFGALFAGPMNRAGEFVGATYLHGYAYQGGGWHMLPELDGATSTVARSINDSGWSVGRMFIGDIDQHAVLWRRPLIPTPVGTGVTVSGNGVTLTFAKVTAAGTTTLSSDSSGNATPGGFMTAGIRYDVSTTASYLPPLDLCVTYDPAALAPGAEQNLRFLHFEAGAWANVTTSVDTVNKIICGRTQSLSPFTMVTPDTVPPAIDLFVPACVPYTRSLQLIFDVRDNSALFIDVDARFDGESFRRGATVTVKYPGLHLVTLRARDAAGNVSRAHKFVWVLPRGKPVSSCSLF
jgi:probable HAF family extracellular repeat protein